MKKRIGIILVCILLIISSLAIVSPSKPLKVSGNTLYVDDDNNSGPWDGTQEHPYRHIQQAIDNASSGDTIFIFNGIYNQIANLGVIDSSVALINKSLNIVGEDKNNTIIDGKANSIFQLQAAPVTIRNVTICNGTGTSSKGLSGYGVVKRDNIHWDDFDHILIDNCIFKDNNIGFCIWFSQNNVSNVSITNCQFINHRYGSISISSETVGSENYILENVQISNCTVKQSAFGILIYRTQNSKEVSSKILTRNITITDCLLTENTYAIDLRSGATLTSDYSFGKTLGWKTSIFNSMKNYYIIDKQFSSKIPLFHNPQTRSASIMNFPVMDQVIIEKNIIVNNNNNASVGISWVGSFSGCIFRNNIVSGSYEESVGHGTDILCYSEGVIITNNHISNAEYGIFAVYGKQNEISYNNFINNSYPGYVYTRIPGISINKWYKNYYDDYIGFGPKKIPGQIGSIGSWQINFYLRWCNIDRHPAKEPYDIQVSEVLH